jgi:hypothetical protein
MGDGKRELGRDQPGTCRWSVPYVDMDTTEMSTGAYIPKIVSWLYIFKPFVPART